MTVALIPRKLGEDSNVMARVVDSTQSRGTLGMLFEQEQDDPIARVLDLDVGAQVWMQVAHIKSTITS